MISEDFEIRGTDIRHVKGDTTYPVLELHLWDAVESIAHTDNIIELAGGFNIDDDAAQFLNDGTLQQRNPVTGERETYTSWMEFNPPALRPGAGEGEGGDDEG